MVCIWQFILPHIKSMSNIMSVKKDIGILNPAINTSCIFAAMSIPTFFYYYTIDCHLTILLGFHFSGTLYRFVPSVTTSGMIASRKWCSFLCIRTFVIFHSICRYNKKAVLRRPCPFKKEWRSFNNSLQK